MTMQKKYIEDENGNKVLPITHFSAVKNSSGDTLEDVLYTESTYDPTTYSGMGRKVLQKNMVGGVNTLTQDMMPVATGGNTIYIIRYDFTLGEDITVPDNGVLEFDGGSISASGSNDTITGNNTGINAGLVKIFNTNVTLDGTWNVAGVYPDWFGAKGDGTTDDTSAFQAALDFAPLHSVLKVPTPKVKYKTTSALRVKKPMSIVGEYFGYDHMETSTDYTRSDYTRCLIESTTTTNVFVLETLGVRIENIGIQTLAVGNAVILIDVTQSGSSTGTARDYVFRNLSLVGTVIDGVGQNMTYGIYCADDVLRSKFDHVQVFFCRSGFYIGSAHNNSTGLTFTNCLVLGSTDYGIYLKSTYHSIISECAFYYNTNSIKLDDCHSISIISATSEESKHSGIYVKDSSEITISTTNFWDVNNTERSNGAAIQNDNSYITITECHVAPKGETLQTRERLLFNENGGVANIIGCRDFYYNYGLGEGNKYISGFENIFPDNIVIKRRYQLGTFGLVSFGISKSDYLITSIMCDEANIIGFPYDNGGVAICGKFINTNWTSGADMTSASGYVNVTLCLKRRTSLLYNP